MNYYIIFWKTWLIDKINTPWPFKFVEYASEFKPKDPSKSAYEKVPEHIVNSVYMSFDNDQIFEFEENHIDGIILSALVDSYDKDSAINSVTRTFKDAEVVECIELPFDKVSEAKEFFSRK